MSNVEVLLWVVLPVAVLAATVLLVVIRSKRARSPDHATPVPIRPAPSGYTAAPPPAAARGALAGTAEGVDLPHGPVLPFALSVACTHDAPPRLARVPAQLTATADGADVPAGPALPFGPSSAPPEVPELTLEEYARLRVQLTARGEEDAETWREFGLGSLAIKEALQARFRREPDAQARFIELVRRCSAEPPAGAPLAGPIATAVASGTTAAT
jgi:uncharacterized lipoprotein YbaY